jgi:hypothetical protein
MCNESFLSLLKKGFLFQEALNEYIDIFFPLTVDCVLNYIIGKEKRYKKLLKYLYLVKCVFYTRVNSLNIFNKVLYFYLGVLDIFIFRYIVVY